MYKNNFIIAIIFMVACGSPASETSPSDFLASEIPGCSENNGTQCPPPCADGMFIGPHGLCTNTCGKDEHCPLPTEYGESCLSGLCGISCDSNESCPEGLICLGILENNICGLPCGGHDLFCREDSSSE